MKHGKVRGSKKALKIKLPRSVVRACHDHRISGSFSYHGNIRGQRAVIYCTDDAKRITDQFMGTIKRASSKASRRWVLALPITDGPRLS